MSLDTPPSKTSALIYLICRKASCRQSNIAGHSQRCVRNNPVGLVYHYQSERQYGVKSAKSPRSPTQQVFTVLYCKCIISS
jgi:hypothetical protein